MTTQMSFTDKQQAINSAIQLSKQDGYAAVIESVTDGEKVYYVENDTPFIRTWETLIAHYDNGKSLKK